MCISLVVADDHPLLLRGLAGLFHHDHFNVVCTCTDGLQALEAVRLRRPDIALLDIAMPKLSGLEVARQIREERLPTRIVLLTAVLREEEVLKALHLGVGGIVAKLEISRIKECVRAVYAGEKWMEEQAAVRALPRMIRREEGASFKGDALTVRQVQIVHTVTGAIRNNDGPASPFSNLQRRLM